MTKQTYDRRKIRSISDPTAGAALGAPRPMRTK